MSNVNNLKPKVVMGIVAHPDDLEFSSAGAMAKYSADGAEVYYYILTNGNKGSDDDSLSCEELRDLRREEQRRAAQILGVKDIFFSDYEDGALECSYDVKRDIARKIRQFRPEVVVTFDPTFVYSAERGMINHTDHRAAGMAVVDAVYPLARDNKSFPELHDEEGLAAHKVSTLLLVNFDKSNYYEDITEQIDLKFEALKAHASQLPDPNKACQMIKYWAENAGKEIGCRYAEGFVRVDLPE